MRAPHTRWRWTLPLLLLLLFIGSARAAPPLMRRPSQVELVPVTDKFTEGNPQFFGMDETGALYGRLGFQLVCWPAGAKPAEFKHLGYLFPLEILVSDVWVGMSADSSTAMGARVVDGSLYLSRVRCDAAVQPLAEVITATEDPALAVFPSPGGNQGRWLSTTPDGAVCMPIGGDVHCYGPAHAIARSFKAADVVPLLDINPEWALALSNHGPAANTVPWLTGQVWSVDAFTLTPDGQMFVLLEVSYWRVVSNSFESAGIRWLVKQAPDGTIAVLTGAFPEARTCALDGGALVTGSIPQVSPLNGATKLIYSAARNAILAWPARWELKTLDEQAPGKGDEGTPVLGARVFPIGSERASGYLSLTRAYAEWVVTGYNVAQSRELFARPDGSLIMEVGVPKTDVPDPNDSPPAAQRLFDVKVDEASLDLDLDGLTATEEAAAGTSDFRLDSDGGGTWDRDELAAGLDPTDATDDPDRSLDRHRVAYSLSTLIRWRVGDSKGGAPPKTDPWRSVQTGGERLDSEPLCIRGTCRGRSGERVATYTATQEFTPMPQSADASMVMLVDGDQVSALYVPEGTVHPLASLSAVGLLASPTGIWSPAAFAVGRHDVYFYSVNEPHRLVLVGDGEPRVAFDLDEVRCASGFGCPGDTGFLAPRFNLSVLGYDTTLKRLWVGVSEQNNFLGVGWILGVHATKPPELIGSPNQIWGAVGSDFASSFGQCGNPNVGGMSVPPWAVDTGHGDMLTVAGRRDPFFSHLPSDLDMFGHPVRRVWGDTLLQQGDLGELFEVVQIPERAEPGELLAYTYDTGGPGVDHGTLWHIPARGGKAEVFTLPKLQVGGMSAAPDGRICLAAPDPGVFIQVRRHALSFGLPNDQITELHVGAVVDCDYGPDGRAHLLMTDPPRVLVYNGPDAALLPDVPPDFEVRPLDAASVPLQLLVNADGTDRVLYDDGQRLGMGRLQDGTVAEVDAATQRLRVHGALLGPDLSGWVNSLHGSNFTLGPQNWQDLRVHIAQRPDGLIAVLPYTPVGRTYNGINGSPPTSVLVIDPKSGQYGELTPYLDKELSNPHALTVLPGGSARDPWTGGPVEVELATGDDEAAVETDAAGGDTADDQAGSGGGGGGGCAGGGKSQPIPWPWLAIVLILATRPGRRRPVNPPPREPAAP